MSFLRGFVCRQCCCCCCCSDPVSHSSPQKTRLNLLFSKNRGDKKQTNKREKKKHPSQMEDMFNLSTTVTIPPGATLHRRQPLRYIKMSKASEVKEAVPLQRPDGRGSTGNSRCERRSSAERQKSLPAVKTDGRRKNKQKITPCVVSAQRWLQDLGICWPIEAEIAKSRKEEVVQIQSDKRQSCTCQRLGSNIRTSRRIRRHCLGNIVRHLSKWITP